MDARIIPYSAIVITYLLDFLSHKGNPGRTFITTIHYPVMCGSYLYYKILLLKTRKKSKYLCVSSIPRKKTRKYWQSYSNHIPTKASGILAFSPVTAAKSQMLIHIQTGFLPPKRLQMIFSLFEFHIIISHMDECPTCGNTGTRFAGTYCFLCLKQQQKPTTPGHLEFKINLVHI